MSNMFTPPNATQTPRPLASTDGLPNPVQIAEGLYAFAQSVPDRTAVRRAAALWMQLIEPDRRLRPPPPRPEAQRAAAAQTPFNLNQPTWPATHDSAYLRAIAQRFAGLAWAAADNPRERAHVRARLEGWAGQIEPVLCVADVLDSVHLNNDVGAGNMLTLAYLCEAPASVLLGHILDIAERDRDLIETASFCALLKALNPFFLRALRTDCAVAPEMVARLIAVAPWDIAHWETSAWVDTYLTHVDALQRRARLDERLAEQRVYHLPKLCVDADRAWRTASAQCALTSRARSPQWLAKARWHAAQEQCIRDGAVLARMRGEIGALLQTLATVTSALNQVTEATAYDVRLQIEALLPPSLADALHGSIAEERNRVRTANRTAALAIASRGSTAVPQTSEGNWLRVLKTWEKHGLASLQQAIDALTRDCTSHQASVVKNTELVKQLHDTMVQCDALDVDIDDNIPLRTKIIREERLVCEADAHLRVLAKALASAQDALPQLTHNAGALRQLMVKAARLLAQHNRPSLLDCLLREATWGMSSAWNVQKSYNYAADLKCLTALTYDDCVILWRLYLVSQVANKELDSARGKSPSFKRIAGRSIDDALPVERSVIESLATKPADDAERLFISDLYEHFKRDLAPRAARAVPGWSQLLKSLGVNLPQPDDGASEPAAATDTTEQTIDMLPAHIIDALQPLIPGLHAGDQGVTWYEAWAPAHWVDIIHQNSALFDSYGLALSSDCGGRTCVTLEIPTHEAWRRLQELLADVQMQKLAVFAQARGVRVSWQPEGLLTFGARGVLAADYPWSQLQMDLAAVGFRLVHCEISGPQTGDAAHCRCIQRRRGAGATCCAQCSRGCAAAVYA